MKFVMKSSDIACLMKRSMTTRSRSGSKLGRVSTSLGRPEPVEERIPYFQGLFNMQFLVFSN
jgi:hypothetical protein